MYTLNILCGKIFGSTSSYKSAFDDRKLVIFDQLCLASEAIRS